MTVQTWKKEFYPIDAGVDDTLVNKIKRDLLKWRGYEKENLDKHHLKCWCNIIIESGRRELTLFCLCELNCSPCREHLEISVSGKGGGIKCPGFIASFHTCNYFYQTSIDTSSPEKIIKWLNIELEYAEKQA